MSSFLALPYSTLQVDRAKLYKLLPKEKDSKDMAWKERGIGELRLNAKKDGVGYRLGTSPREL